MAKNNNWLKKGINVGGDPIMTAFAVSTIVSSENKIKGIAQAIRDIALWRAFKGLSIVVPLLVAARGMLRSIVKESGSLEAALNKISRIKGFTKMFEPLANSAEEARKKVAALMVWSNKSPFSAEKVMGAARSLEVMSKGLLQGEKNMDALGAIARRTGSDLEEVAHYVGMLYSDLSDGRPIEATVDMLTQLGVISQSANNKLKRLQDTGAGFSESWALVTREMEEAKAAMAEGEKTAEEIASAIDRVKQRMAENFGASMAEAELKAMENQLKMWEAIEPVAAKAAKAMSQYTSGLSLMSKLGGKAADIGAIEAGGKMAVQGADAVIKGALTLVAIAIAKWVSKLVPGSAMIAAGRIGGPKVAMRIARLKSGLKEGQMGPLTREGQAYYDKTQGLSVIGHARGAMGVVAGWTGRNIGVPIGNLGRRIIHAAREREGFTGAVTKEQWQKASMTSRAMKGLGSSLMFVARGSKLAAGGLFLVGKAASFLGKTVAIGLAIQAIFSVIERLVKHANAGKRALELLAEGAETRRGMAKQIAEIETMTDALAAMGQAAENSTAAVQALVEASKNNEPSAVINALWENFDKAKQQEQDILRQKNFLKTDKEKERDKEKLEDKLWAEKTAYDMAQRRETDSGRYGERLLGRAEQLANRSFAGEALKDEVVRADRAEQMSKIRIEQIEGEIQQQKAFLLGAERDSTSLNKKRREGAIARAKLMRENIAKAKAKINAERESLINKQEVEGGAYGKVKADLVRINAALELNALKEEIGSGKATPEQKKTMARLEKLAGSKVGLGKEELIAQKKAGEEKVAAQKKLAEDYQANREQVYDMLAQREEQILNKAAAADALARLGGGGYVGGGSDKQLNELQQIRQLMAKLVEAAQGGKEPVSVDKYYDK